MQINQSWSNASLAQSKKYSPWTAAAAATLPLEMERPALAVYKALDPKPLCCSRLSMLLVTVTVCITVTALFMVVLVLMVYMLMVVMVVMVIMVFMMFMCA